MNKFLYADTFAEGYKKILSQVFNKPDFLTSPRGIKTKECINLGLEISNPYANLFDNCVRPFNLKYLCGELVWYFNANNSVEFIQNFSKFWKKIANSDGTCNSAYGYLLFEDGWKLNKEQYDEWSWAKDNLLADINTRKAIIHFNKPWHMYFNNKDFPCTIYGIFNIRENKLNFSIFMRSSDSILGTTYDIPFFMLLHQEMYLKLKNGTPYYINESNDCYSNLEIGKFTYFSNSQHIYEQHFDLVEKMLNEEFIDKRLPRIKESLVLHPDLKIITSSVLNNTDLKIATNDELINFIYSNIKGK